MAGEADVRVSDGVDSGDMVLVRSTDWMTVRTPEEPDFAERGLVMLAISPEPFELSLALSTVDLDVLETRRPSVPRKFGLVSARPKLGLRGPVLAPELDSRRRM